MRKGRWTCKKKKHNASPVTKDSDWLFQRLAKECGRHKMEALFVLEAGMRLAAVAAGQLGFEKAMKMAMEVFNEEVMVNGAVKVEEKEGGE